MSPPAHEQTRATAIVHSESVLTGAQPVDVFESETYPDSPNQTPLDTTNPQPIGNLAVTESVRASDEYLGGHLSEEIASSQSDRASLIEIIHAGSDDKTALLNTKSLITHSFVRCINESAGIIGSATAPQEAIVRYLQELDAYRDVFDEFSDTSGKKLPFDLYMDYAVGHTPLARIQELYYVSYDDLTTEKFQAWTNALARLPVSARMSIFARAYADDFQSLSEIAKTPELCDNLAALGIDIQGAASAAILGNYEDETDTQKISIAQGERLRDYLRYLSGLPRVVAYQFGNTAWSRLCRHTGELRGTLSPFAVRECLSRLDSITKAFTAEEIVMLYKHAGIMNFDQYTPEQLTPSLRFARGDETFIEELKNSDVTMVIKATDGDGTGALATSIPTFASKHTLYREVADIDDFESIRTTLLDSGVKPAVIELSAHGRDGGIFFKDRLGQDYLVGVSWHWGVNTIAFHEIPFFTHLPQLMQPARGKDIAPTSRPVLIMSSCLQDIPATGALDSRRKDRKKMSASSAEVLAEQVPGIYVAALPDISNVTRHRDGVVRFVGPDRTPSAQLLAELARMPLGGTEDDSDTGTFVPRKANIYTYNQPTRARIALTSLGIMPLRPQHHSETRIIRYLPQS